MTTNDILKDYIIYKIYCKNKEITDEYYGHTSAFRERKYMHKGSCNNEHCKGYNQEKYKIIRDNGGWDNWIMSPIEELKNCSLINAKIREQFHIDLNKSKMNQLKAYITEEQKIERNKKIQKEYYEIHKEEILEKVKNYYEIHKEEKIQYHKNYYETNKEEIVERSKINYDTNKEVILQKQKEHYEIHKQEILERQHIYHENNKEEINEKAREKITCSCGSTFTKKQKLRHEKSLKHQTFINS